jgi:hypothetical protein
MLGSEELLFEVTSKEIDTFDSYCASLARDKTCNCFAAFTDPDVLARCEIAKPENRAQIYNILCKNLRQIQTREDLNEKERKVIEQRFALLMRKLAPIPRAVSHSIDRQGFLRISLGGVLREIRNRLQFWKKSWQAVNVVPQPAGVSIKAVTMLGTRPTYGITDSRKKGESPSISSPVTFGYIDHQAELYGKNRRIIVAMTRRDEFFNKNGSKMDVHGHDLLAGIGDFLREAKAISGTNGADIDIMEPTELRYDPNKKVFKKNDGSPVDIKNLPRGTYVLLDSEEREIGAIFNDSTGISRVYLNFQFCDHSAIDAFTGEVIKGSKLREYLDIQNSLVDDAFLYEHCFSAVDRAPFIEKCRGIMQGETILEADERVHKQRPQAKTLPKMQKQLRSKLGELFVHELAVHPERMERFLAKSDANTIAANLAELFFLPHEEIFGTKEVAIENQNNFGKILQQLCIRDKEQFTRVCFEISKRTNGIHDLPRIMRSRYDSNCRI